MDISSELEATKFFNRTNPKAFTDVKTTPVILVCIYNKNSTLITHDLLYNVFSAYGKILRILIFEKVKVWKAFIEFSNVEEAIEAKRNLNDFLLFSDGTRINIYPSNLEHVKFQNNNSGGVDYTLTEQPDLSQFKDQFPLPVPEATGNTQPEAPPTFQNQFPTDTNNNYDSIAERSNSTNSQSQPNSGKLKWPVPEAEDQEERFPNQPHEHNQDSDVSPYGQEYHQNENYEEGQFSHKLFNDAFPSSSWNTQDIGYKRKNQALQLNSPAFQDPNQPIKQPPPMQNQNPNSFWPQGMPNNNMNNLGNMQQNMNNFGNMQSHNLNNLGNMQSNTNIQMPVNNSAPPGLVRMTNANSFTNIPIRQNPQQLSRNNTFTDLPPPSNPMNPGPGPGPNRGLLPRFATLNDLPKSSNTMMKPGLPQFGSVTDLGGFGMGGMNQGMNQRMNPGLGQGLQQGPPQLNKPMLNSRFGSTPELPMMSEISKYKLDSMSTQSLRDLIERDILIRLMMNQIQNESGDLMQQNNNLINDLNDIKKYSPALPGVGDVDYNDLTKMNKTTLDQIYQDLSNILGKTIENKECAVLYVKGLEHKDIKVRMLYNIFSNFGNIKKIIFIRRQAAALIEYETVEYAAKAKEDLSNIVFMGKPLRIYYSFHPIINLKNKKNGKDASEEIFIGTPKTFRFGKAKTISMNPPSATIHVSNLTKEVCNEDTMRNFFSPFGRIEAIQIKCMENNRNMCLIRMASMEESLNAMAYLHDVELGGRPVQISFTKSKI